jgi:hypothetical protein
MFFSGIKFIDGISSIYIKQIKYYLYSFLSNPLAHLRNLGSKTFAVIVTSSTIEYEIYWLKSEVIITYSFNLPNGYLYTLKYLYEKQDAKMQSITMKHTNMKLLDEV